MTESILNYSRASDVGHSIDWNRAVLIGGVLHALLELAAWLIYLVQPGQTIRSVSSLWVIIMVIELVVCGVSLRGAIDLRKTRWLLGVCIGLDLVGYIWLLSQLLPLSNASRSDPRWLIAAGLAYLMNAHWRIGMIVGLQPDRRADPQRTVKRLLIVAMALVATMLLRHAVNAGVWWERLKLASTSFSGAARELDDLAAAITLVSLVLASLKRVTVTRALLVSATAFATAGAAALADQAFYRGGLTDLGSMGLALLWRPQQAWVIYVLAVVLVFRIPIAKPVYRPLESALAPPG